jgi:hypothetical protein
MTTWREGVWSWFCPVYHTSFVLVRCPRADAAALLRQEIPQGNAVEQIARRMDPAITHYRGQFFGFNHEEHGDIALIWLHPNAGFDTLGHELVHALTSVLAERGLRLSDDSDEAFAYYLAWLIRECLQRLEGAIA